MSAEGIETRHARSCPARTKDENGDRGKCKCRPTFQAHVWSAREGRIRRTFPTLAAAKSWRSDADVAKRKGTLKAPTQVTLRQAATAWLEGVKAGTIRARSGDPYKPSVIRSYEVSLRKLRLVADERKAGDPNRVRDERLRLLDLGGLRLSEIRRVDVQDIVAGLDAAGFDPSTVANTLMPVRVIFRRAVSRGDLTVNPTTGLEFPRVRGRRERIAGPDEADRLLAALPADIRALYATAGYAGLRRGELMALEHVDVDLATGIIRVERGWDLQAGVIETKNRQRRTVPIPAVLRDHLDEHKLRTGRSEGLVFGVTSERPFSPSAVRRRAETAWKQLNARLEQEDEREGRKLRDAERLRPIGLHELRHTFASLMIAAGVNAKALSSYLGHSSIDITMDRYGHLMPGNEDEAAALLDADLERANTRARVATIAQEG